MGHGDYQLSLKPASFRYQDFAAVGIGDIVEAEKLPGTPANRGNPAVVLYGLGLDIARGEIRGSLQEKVTSRGGQETSGGPGTKIVRRDELW